MRMINRRDFLKLGAASAAVLAIESQFHPFAYAAERLAEGGRSVNRTSGLPRSFLPSTCTQCTAGCGTIGYVEESRLVKIGGNPKHLSNESALCARGQAGINALYDPDRLLKPLKRVGQRGRNSWQEISWEQAYKEVAENMNALKTGGAQDFIFLTDDLERDALGRRFTNAFGSANAFGASGIYDANKRAGTSLTWGKEGDMPDVANSKYILSFGANPYESGPQFVGFARRLVDGVVKNQAKLVVFDVRLTNTSAKATEVFYVQPGTYALVALAMANVIMQEGLYDGAFIESWTNVSPAQLAQHLAEYTPERAEAETGVSATVIRRIAAEFATTKPATTVTDNMLSAHKNGVQNERAAMLLNIITGNIDRRGGLCLPRQYDLTDPVPVPATPAPTAATGQSIVAAMTMIKQRKQPVGVLMTHGFNPVYANPDGTSVEETLKDETLIKYHVAITPFINETAAMADIILPETTYLEDWDIEVRPSLELVPFVALRQPVVPPLDSAKAFFDIVLELSGTIGGMQQFFPWKSVDGWLKARISGIDGLMKAGGLDYLKQHGVWYDPKSRPNYSSYQAGGFPTPSGRIEVYSQNLASRNFAPLPVYEPIAAFRTISEEKNEMILTIYDTALQTDYKTGNCMWIDEILHNNPAWINPETAARLGIIEGDSIKIRRTSRSGEAKIMSIETTAFLSEGVHPRVVAMANGVGHTDFGHVAEGEKFEKNGTTVTGSEIPKFLQDPNSKLIWWGEKGGIGVNAKDIVPADMDPIGGGEAWGDVVVVLAKS